MELYFIGFVTSMLTLADVLVKAKMHYSKEFIFKEKEITKTLVLKRMLFIVIPFTGVIYDLIKNIRYFISLPL